MVLPQYCTLGDVIKLGIFASGGCCSCNQASRSTHANSTPIGSPGVQKDSAPLGGAARLFIKHRSAFCLHIGQRSVDIVHFQADMMETFVTFLEESCQAGVGVGWLDEFDFAAARAC